MEQREQVLSGLWARPLVLGRRDHCLGRQMKQDKPRSHDPGPHTWQTQALFLLLHHFPHVTPFLRAARERSEPAPGVGMSSTFSGVPTDTQQLSPSFHTLAMAPGKRLRTADLGHWWSD